MFTPNGDVIELPVGSTPIDFAYKVHTNVGHKMVGAIVNGAIVPLDYELKDNDIIKINTNNNSKPSREWIGMAKTTGAKNKIKSFFNKIDKESYTKDGEELINKELRKRKISLNEFFSDENKEKILSELKFNNIEELYVNIANGKVTPSSVINTIYNINKSKHEIILENVQNSEVKAPTVKNDIIVEGINEIKVNVASCCKPVPEDRIVGYITKGYGITVHRIVCPNMNDLEDRTIAVKWNEEVSKKYPTSLLIRSEKGKDLLLEIISRTSNSNITVKSINNLNSSDMLMCELTILVSGKESLMKFISELESMKDIISVERMMK